jgi:hypothetical protein
MDYESTALTAELRAQLDYETVGLLILMDASAFVARLSFGLTVALLCRNLRCSPLASDSAAAWARSFSSTIL